MTRLTRRERLIKDAIAASGARGPNSNGEYAVCCPFCRMTQAPDTKYKLQLNVTKGNYHCYRCSTSGYCDTGALLDVEAVAAQAEVTPRELEPWPEDAEALDPKAIVHRPYVDYLAKRRLLDEALNAKAHVCLTGYYAGRVLIPHVVLGGKLGDLNYYDAGFSARTIRAGVEPKYLYPRGMDKRQSLWGLHLHRGHTLFVVEGVFDALGLYGCAVATFGKNISDEQLDLLAQRGAARAARIVMCLDGDAWEECAAYAMRLRLRGLTEVQWAKLPPGKDPGDLKHDVARYIVG